MNVVLDCNVLIMCISSRSPYHIIYRGLVNAKFQIGVTTDIILEYEEIIQRKYGTKTADTFIALLNELPNVHYITSYYKWLLIKTDPDDNKYVDCAIAAKADFLVTEDRHFNVLKTLSFPQVDVMSIDKFKKIVEGL